MDEIKYSYFLNLVVAVDQLLNAFLGGSCDETLSSRTYRMARIKGGAWAKFEKFVNFLFWKDRDSEGRRHCEMAYIVEVDRIHMPKSFYRLNEMDTSEKF